MKLKSMLKFALAALFLGAGVSVFAEGPVTLSNGQTVSWADFASTINNGKVADPETELPADNQYALALDAAKTNASTAATYLTNAKAEYQDATDSVALWRTRIQSYETERSILNASDNKETPEWLATAYENAQNFKAQYKTGGADTPVAYYIWDQTTDENNWVLYLSFAEQVPTNQIAGQSWNSVDGKELYNMFCSGRVNKDGAYVDEIYVYFGTDYSKSGLMSVLAPASYSHIMTYVVNGIQTIVDGGKFDVNPNATKIKEYNDSITAINGRITDWTITLWVGETSKDGKTTFTKPTTAGQGATKVNYLTSTYADAQTAKADADAALATAQANYKTALDDLNATALEAYNDVTLTADVTVSTTITKTYTGTINGGGKIINSTVPVFKNFSGVMHDVAVNGTFADVYNNASFSDVAVWTGSKGRFYAEDGTLTSGLDTIQALGYAARDLYGVNWTTGKIVAKTDLTTVHQVTTYSFTNQTGNMVYAQVNADKNNFVSETGAALIEENKFVKADNSDFPATLSNVFYQTKNGYVCPKATIVDKNNLYVPAKINVGTLNYARTFSEGLSTACLPFAVSATASDEAIYNENIDYVATFDQLAGQNFWFTQKDQSVAVAAYTPVLINATAAFSFGTISNAILPKTDSQYTKDQGNDEERSFSVGTVVKATPATIISNVDATGMVVYGLAAETKEFQQAAPKSSFASLRMFVVSDYTGPNGAPRKIIVFDEDGVEVDSTDAIVTVEAADNSVNVATTQGQIVFTSEADCGTVQIYTIDGKVAANVEVMAGLTTVDMPQGLYIVMGKKVMVK